MPSPGEVVAALPRRTAHALHALVECARELQMPVTAAEIMLYDEEASSPRSTGNALAHARQLGLATFDGHCWWPDPAAHLRAALEERYLKETARDSDEDEGKEAQCVQCGEMKADPWDFWDGLLCITCAEEDDDELDT